MLQNSLDRLLTGMAATLHQRVLPAVDDPAVGAQVRAMVELLGNLSTRVTWDPAHLVATRERLAIVLEEAAAHDDVPDGLGVARSRDRADVLDAAALQADVADDLERLGEVQDWLAAGGADSVPALAAVVEEFVDWELATELDRLRSARFGRP